MTLFQNVGLEGGRGVEPVYNVPKQTTGIDILGATYRPGQLGIQVNEGRPSSQ